MFRTLFAGGAAALALVAATGAAQAAVTRVTVDTSLFDDGGSVAGWFDYDDEAFGAPSAWDLTTTAGTALAGDHYLSGGADQTSADTTLLYVFRAFAFTHAVGSEQNQLHLLLTDGPETTIEFHMVCDGCYDGPHRIGHNSYTEAPAPAPEPGVWALSVLGFGLAGATLRRRRRSAAA